MRQNDKNKEEKLLKHKDRIFGVGIYFIEWNILLFLIWYTDYILFGIASDYFYVYLTRTFLIIQIYYIRLQLHFPSLIWVYYQISNIQDVVRTHIKEHLHKWGWNSSCSHVRGILKRRCELFLMYVCASVYFFASM